jgi:hypothetical protein
MIITSRRGQAGSCTSGLLSLRWLWSLSCLRTKSRPRPPRSALGHRAVLPHGLRSIPDGHNMAGDDPAPLVSSIRNLGGCRGHPPETFGRLALGPLRLGGRALPCRSETEKRSVLTVASTARITSLTLRLHRADSAAALAHAAQYVDGHDVEVWLWAHISGGLKHKPPLS